MAAKSTILKGLARNLTRCNLSPVVGRHIATSSRLYQEAQTKESYTNELSDFQLELQRTRPVTNNLHIIEPLKVPTVESYRVLEQDGSLSGELDAELTADRIVQLYSEMLTLNSIDKVLYDSQRQGRISFYMTNIGEEAAQVGSAAALHPDDWVVAQYREAGVLIHRKMPLKQMLAQCLGNKEDLGKGRQMPVHYGSKELNFLTISSPLTTQMPQAVGSAYALKMDPAQRHKIVISYFGDGAASEGDFHAAMNFAATLSCPIVFFCRNNGYAISTPTSDQYAGDGIVNRGLGYGISSIRVDGNDLFAVFAATKRAKQICLEQSRPVLIEAMTYRIGHHSTSDDSSAYRDKEEVKHWETELSPIKRVYKYLMRNGLWSDEREQQILRDTRASVLKALSHAEKVKKLPIDTMFEDVYDVLPANLQRQRDELKEHLGKYGEHYPINEYST